MPGAAIDFAWSKPPPALLVSLGITVVIVYVGPESWGKTITQAEFNAYVDAGIAVVLVFERTADDAASGPTGGAANAQLALANAPTFPGGSYGVTRPIYFAEDSDVVPATREAYWQGICSVIPATMVGDYGEGDLNQLLHDAGLSSWHWLSGSTSYPGSSAPTPGLQHIWQKVGNPVPGYDTDPDELLTVDVGQYPQPQQEDDMQPAPVKVAPNETVAMVVPRGTGPWALNIGFDEYAYPPGSPQHYPAAAATIPVRLAAHAVFTEAFEGLAGGDDNWVHQIPKGSSGPIALPSNIDEVTVTNEGLVPITVQFDVAT